MAHDPQKIRDLAMQIESLEPEDRQELLRLVFTPEEELFSLVRRLHRKVRCDNPRVIARDVNQTVREVRAQRRLASTSPTK
jgi:hypothetical protein